MASSKGDIDAAISKLCDEWNKAEKAIKLAEQVNGEIVNPAIYELRYGGRRVVEALTVVEPAPANVASIPFMITQEMRAKLRDLGSSDEDIAKMTPQEAHDYIKLFE